MTDIAWGKKVSPAFKDKVIAISAGLRCNPSHLMSAMAFESAGTFSPAVRNRISGATGLIQFMPATAHSMGTTTDALASLTAEQQLDWVQRYLKPFTGRMFTVADVYMTILWPAAVGKPDSAVIFPRGTLAYKQNAGLDLDRDGQVTKREAAHQVELRLQTGLGPGYFG